MNVLRIPVILSALAVAVASAAAPAGSSARLYSTDFSRGAGDWTVVSGTFAMENGAYRSRAVETDKRLSRAVVGDKTWRDYRVTARMKLEAIANPRADLGVIARYQDADNYYVFLYKTEAKKVTIETKIKGKLRTVAEAPIELAAGQWHDFQVTVSGGNLALTVNARPVAKVTHDAFVDGGAGLLAFWADVQVNRFTVETVAAP